MLARKVERVQAWLNCCFKKEDENMSKKPTVLMILDGYGLSDKTEGNAVALAKTPVMDALDERVSLCKGLCQRPGSGTAGGPDGQL